MDQNFLMPPPSRATGVGRVFTWVMGIVCYGLLLSMMVLIARQIIIGPPAHRVVLMRNIPLPPALLEKDDTDNTSLEPGQSQDFDSFGFQAIDPKTHLLFIAHSGPIPFNFTFEDPSFRFDNPDDLARDGNILVFDLQKQQLVGRVPIPRVTGLIVAPDLGKVFAAGSEENRIYSFDEPSLTNITHLQLGEYDDPDSLTYDPGSQKLFVAAQDGRPKFGYKVGHIKYNEVNHRVYLATQISPDENDRSGPLPPNGSGELMVINPDSYTVEDRILLPESCNFPHALELDTKASLAYTDCTEVDADEPLVQHLIRVDLKTRKVFPDDPFKTMLAPAPNMIVLDRPQQLIFVGCSGGVTVFDVRPGHFHKLGSYVIGKDTSSIIVDEATQFIYLPTPGAGGRPTLHIAKYYPLGD